MRDKEPSPCPMGPILFGVFATAWDMLFIRIKHTARKVLADARRAADKGE